MRQSLAVGSSTGEPLHVLSFLEQPSPLWQTDVEAARESLSASLSLLLRLIGRDPDPTRSRDHVVLSILAERRLRTGQAADVASLLEDVRTPPLDTLGAMPIDEYLPRRERTALATALNTLLASPTFEAWRNANVAEFCQLDHPGHEGVHHPAAGGRRRPRGGGTRRSAQEGVHKLYRTFFRGDVYPDGRGQRQAVLGFRDRLVDVRGHDGVACDDPGGRLQLVGAVPAKLGSLAGLLALALTAASADEALR
jgi:hypothetical protein